MRNVKVVEAAKIQIDCWDSSPSANLEGCSAFRSHWTPVHLFAFSFFSCLVTTSLYLCLPPSPSRSSLLWVSWSLTWLWLAVHASRSLSPSSTTLQIVTRPWRYDSRVNFMYMVKIHESQSLRGSWGLVIQIFVFMLIWRWWIFFSQEANYRFGNFVVQVWLSCILQHTPVY